MVIVILNRIERTMTGLIDVVAEVLVEPSSVLPEVVINVLAPMIVIVIAAVIETAIVTEIVI